MADLQYTSVVFDDVDHYRQWSDEMGWELQIGHQVHQDLTCRVQKSTSRATLTRGGYRINSHGADSRRSILLRQYRDVGKGIDSLIKNTRSG